MAVDNPKKEFIDTILSFQSHDVWTVFSDFFAVTALEFRCSLSSFEFKRGDLEQKKAAINQIYAKYQDKEKELFPKLYALLEMLIDAEIQNKHFTDIAGAIFHELDAGNKHTGQFFTPQHLADLTAGLCLDAEKIRELIAKNGCVRFSEPASGAGAMILAWATAISKCGYNPQKVMFIHATDIDIRCVNMCYVQLSLYGLPAVVVHGDTLTLKTWDTMYTPIYYFDWWNLKNERFKELSRND